MPAKPPLGTDMWKFTVEPLMVPCIDPLPIMSLPVSLKLIVPVMLVPFCVTAQLIFSCPVLSAEVPTQVPVNVLRLPDEAGDGDAGEDEEPPHAEAIRPARRAQPRYLMLIVIKERFGK
jgi:hypothetical protein